ncbi:hypothetical protein BH11PSE8_BH11PSE8_30750 [soil metagenome]
MTHPPVRALVFMNGRNCARYVTAALESLVRQTHPAIHILFVDDCSTDETAQVAQQFLQDYFHGRHTLVRNPANWGKGRNAHVHLRANLGQGDFVAMMDADDQLISATILADMAAQYRAGFDVVWSNYETDQGQPGHNTALDPFQSPRAQGWKTSHFFTFRSELFPAIGEDYFKDENGDWLPAANDRAIAYPVLDQTRRYHFMPVKAYRYTATNPESHHNQDPLSVGLSSRRQMRFADTVDAKPPLPCTRWLFGEHGAADQTVNHLFQQLLTAKPAVAQQAPPVPVKPTHAQPADVQADSGTWATAAASALHERCPGLLDLAMDGLAPLPPVGQLWSWWQWLQRGPAQPKVLEIGAGKLSAALHAMVRGLGGSITSVSGDTDRAGHLYARLRGVGIEAEVTPLPLADAEFEGTVGRFPDISLLDDSVSNFDLVVVCAETCGLEPSDAILSLPMLVPRLKPEGFRVCVWSPANPRPLRDALAAWRRAAPDLNYAEHELGGLGIVVQS